MKKTFFGYLCLYAVPVWLVAISVSLIGRNAENKLKSIEQSMQDLLKTHAAQIAENHQRLSEVEKQCDQQQKTQENLTNRIDEMYKTILSVRFSSKS